MVWLLFFALAYADMCQDLFVLREGLEINTVHNHITWKGRTFYAPQGEVALVDLLTSGPRIWEYDDLILKYYGRTHEGLIDAKRSIVQIAHNTKKRFLEVDPTFNHIRTMRKVGIYWYHDDYELYQRGTISIAKYFQVAYYRMHQVDLTEGEHYILSRLVRVPHIRRDGFVKLNVNSVPVIICNLNAKFMHLIGERLIVLEDDFWTLNSGPE